MFHTSAGFKNSFFSEFSLNLYFFVSLYYFFFFLIICITIQSKRKYRVSVSQSINQSIKITNVWRMLINVKFPHTIRLFIFSSNYPSTGPYQSSLVFLYCFYLTVILFVCWSYSWNIIVEQSQCHCTTEQYIKILSTINHVLLDGCRIHSDKKRVIVWLLFNAKWATIMGRTNYIQWNGDDVRFVLNQQA